MAEAMAITWDTAAAVIISVIAAFTAATATSEADGTGMAIAAIGMADTGAIVVTGMAVTGATAVTGTAAGGPTESAAAGAGRRTTTASYGFATEAL